MNIKSVFKPEGSVIAALATGVLVAAIYNQNLPSTAQMSATDAGDPNIDSARKKATWEAAGAVSAIALISRDMNVLILGGVVLFAMDLAARHANATHPVTGDLVSPAPGYRQLRVAS